MIAIVIWDADGTLLASIPLINAHARGIAELLGLSGVQTYRQLMRTVESSHLPQGADGVVRDFHRLTVRALCHTTQVVDGILDVVKGLGTRQGVVTAGYASTVTACLGPARSLFEFIQGYEDGPKDSLLMDHSAHSVYVTDSVMDIQRCLLLDIPTVAVSWGIDDATSLKKAGATRVSETMESLRRELSSMLAEANAGAR